MLQTKVKRQLSQQAGVLFAVTLVCYEHVEVDKSLEFRSSILVQYRLSVYLSSIYHCSINVSLLNKSVWKVSRVLNSIWMNHLNYLLNQFKNSESFTKLLCDFHCCSTLNNLHCRIKVSGNFVAKNISSSTLTFCLLNCCMKAFV